MKRNKEHKKVRHPQLSYEAKIMKILQGERIQFTTAGIPSIMYYGEEGDFNVMVLDLLGPCLEDLFNYCGRRFTLKTSLMVADQFVCVLLALKNRIRTQQIFYPQRYQA